MRLINCGKCIRWPTCRIPGSLTVLGSCPGREPDDLDVQGDAAFGFKLRFAGVEELSAGFKPGGDVFLWNCPLVKTIPEAYHNWDAKPDGTPRVVSIGFTGLVDKAHRPVKQAVHATTHAAQTAAATAACLPRACGA